jgi:hypothetical protein
MTDTVSSASLQEWIRAFARLVAESRDHLTDLDAAIGAGFGAVGLPGLVLCVVFLLVVRDYKTVDTATTNTAESSTRGDMIRFKKSTTSYDRILESGGAFNIKVTQNGEQLKIAQQKLIILMFLM